MEPRSRLQIKLEQERIAKVTGEHHTNGAIDQGGLILDKFLAFLGFAAYYDDSSSSCCSPTLLYTSVHKSDERRAAVYN